MPPVSRETVLSAVQLYGTAWTTQDPSILPTLFTFDAIYVERAYDKNATFRGLDDITGYWKYQICGKQSNIHFRHITSELIRDADQPIAVVKWLAEFDNRRENRAGVSSDKTYKRVRFCQLAKLIFEGSKICYLEEYNQGMIGPGVRWPGLEASDAELWRRVRQDEDLDTSKVKKTISCSRCGVDFPSRTQLFRHINSTEAREDGLPGCVPTDEEEDTFDWVCLSLGYIGNDGLEDLLRRALMALTGDEATTSSVEMDTLTWAVPRDWSSSAVVNVVSIKMRQSFVNKISASAMPSLLNQHLENAGVRIHTVVVVDRPCVHERREFEKFEAFIPWALLQEEQGDATKNDYNTCIPRPTTDEAKGWSRQNNHRRTPLEETKAGEFVDPAMALRLRNGARLLKDGGRTDLGHFADSPEEIKIRIRTCTMDEPWHRFCRISVSMRQPRPGYIENLIGLLIAYARSKLSEEELVSAALKLFAPGITRSTCTQNDGTQSVPSFPTDFVCLLEPALVRYECRSGVSLCGGSAAVTEEMMSSLDKTEGADLSNMHCKLAVLEQWVQSF